MRTSSSGLNPATTMLPSKHYLMDRLGQLEIDPKSWLQRNNGAGGGRQQTYLANEPRDESVETKWEHLQYYEQRLEDPQMSLDLPSQQQPEYSSMASCSTGSSTSSSHSSAGSSGSSRLSARAVKEGWKRFKSQIMRGGGGGGGSKSRMHGTTSYNDFGPSAVSTAPGGQQQQQQQRNGVIPRLRSSKSLQNLEAITRDSYYNLRDATTNLKEKYHSRMELRQARPKTDYVEFWDEDDPDGQTRASLRMVGLE